MTETDLQRQLAELQEQVATLAAARAATATEPPAEAPDDAPPEEAHPAPREQIDELVQLLEKELRENPVVSGLAIFAAGVLVGRLLR